MYDVDVMRLIDYSKKKLVVFFEQLTKSGGGLSRGGDFMISSNKYLIIAFL